MKFAIDNKFFYNILSQPKVHHRAITDLSGVKLGSYAHLSGLELGYSGFEAGDFYSFGTDFPLQRLLLSLYALLQKRDAV